MSQAFTPRANTLSIDDPFYPLIEGTVLRLAPLFSRQGRTDQEALTMASRAITSYQPQSPSEIPIIVRIIMCTFNALEASTDALDPDLTDAERFRLIGRANSLSRTAAQAERLLFQTNSAARATVMPPEAKPHAAKSPDAKPPEAKPPEPKPTRQPPEAQTKPAPPGPRPEPPTAAQMRADLEQLQQHFRDQSPPSRDKLGMGASQFATAAADANRTQPAFTK
jgi:hypothetical protein